MDHLADPSRGLRAATYAGTSVVILLAALTVGGAWRAGFGWDQLVTSYVLTNAVIGASFAPGGWLIARARPRNPIGLLFLITSVAHLLSAAGYPWLIYGLAAGWPEPALRTLVTVFLASWGWGLPVALMLILQLFPDGRVLPRWRWLVWVTVATGMLGTYGTGPSPWLGASSYLVLPGHEFVERYLLPATGVVGPLSIASLVVRYRRGNVAVRRQLLWLLLPSLVAVGVNVPWTFAFHEGNEILFLLAFPLIPIGLTIGMLRHSWFDVRLAVSRVFVYEVLTLAVFGAYLGLVSGLGDWLPQTGSAVLAAMVVAVVFNPLRLGLQSLVDRALYGAAGDPLRVVSSVGQQLTSTGSLDDVLRRAREVLRFPYAAVELGDRRVAASGIAPAELHRTTLTFGDEPAGQLVVGMRPGELTLSSRDRTVLELLAGPLTIAARATALAAVVKESRQRLVHAAEEERRRLHRELHDSLGPVLTGVAMKADAVSLAVHSDPVRAERLASEVSEQLRTATAEVRQIVYGLRPPALDELGLIGSIRQYAAQLSGLTVEVLDPGLPALPAAVETAAYRIATEAVTNVVRHASASSARVEICADERALQLTVGDNGVRPGAWVPGVGLSSMEERVAELGGSWTAGPSASGGLVRVTLPLGDPS